MHCIHPSDFCLPLLLNGNSVEVPLAVPHSLEQLHMFPISDRWTNWLQQAWLQLLSTFASARRKNPGAPAEAAGCRFQDPGTYGKHQTQKKIPGAPAKAAGWRNQDPGMYGKRWATPAECPVDVGPGMACQTGQKFLRSTTKEAADVACCHPLARSSMQHDTGTFFSRN